MTGFWAAFWNSGGLHVGRMLIESALAIAAVVVVKAALFLEK